MLDGMSDCIQGSRIKNLHSREVDRQSPTGLIFNIEDYSYKLFCIMLVRSTSLSDPFSILK